MKLGDGVAPVLEAMRAASPRFSGIRHATGWDASPELAQRDIQGVMATSQYRDGARVLAKMSLTLDNSIYHTQLDELAALARAVPELTIVLNHIGGLVRVGPYADRDDEVLADWRRGVAAVAVCPNVVLKLGGVGQKRFGFGWFTRAKPIGSEELAQALAPLMHYCIEKFGPDRCMFESNFPVDKVSYAYGIVWNAFKRLSKDYAAKLLARIEPARARPAREIHSGGATVREGDNTTHFSVVDRFGNAVSNTTTLNFSYGVGLVAGGTGVLLNN